MLVCKELSSDMDFNGAMMYAAMWGHEHIVQLCKEWGTTWFNATMLSAASFGHEHIVSLCKNFGATDFFAARFQASF